jgi:hypothetical protein
MLAPVNILRGIGAQPIVFALCGALTGAAAAACTLVQIGEVGALTVGGYCLGVQATSTSACGGVDGALYAFPGLAFGVVFGPLLHFYRRLSVAGAVAYALSAALANAAAVAVCIALLHPVDDLLPFDSLIPDTAISGIIAGAVGGGLLGASLMLLDPAAGRALPIAVAAGLGVLTPVVIMFDQPAVFAFYIIWQGGYAAAVAFSLPRPTGGDTPAVG